MKSFSASRGDKDQGLTNLVEHDIPTTADTRPIRQPVRHLGPKKEKEVTAQVDKLLERGFIEPSSSAWSSPVVPSRRRTILGDSALNIDD